MIRPVAWPCGARLSGWTILCTQIVTAAVAQQAEVAPLRAPLAAEVRFVDTAGQTLDLIQPDTPFEVMLDIRSQMGALPTDLLPMAWLRERGPTDLPCGETAAAYRAAGRAAIGSVDLNGVVLGIVMRDGSFTILDPERALGTANLLAARRFDPAPSALTADPVAGRFLISLPGKDTASKDGKVLAMSPYGQDQVLADALDQPGAIVSTITGGGWLLERGTGDVIRLGQAAVKLRLPLNGRQIIGDADTDPTQRLAVLSQDRITVLEDDGRETLSLPAPGALAVALNTDTAMWLTPGELHVIWLDAPDQPLTIPLPGDFDRLATSPEGRMVYLFAQDRTGFAVVDLALGRVVQGVDTDSPVAELAFLPATAFLRLADQSSVGVMDLREITPDTEAAVGRVIIGPGRPEAETKGATLLAPLLPEPSLLAVHAESYSGFVLDGRHAVSGKPPMEALRLRGGIPQHVRALNRSLRQTAPGHFVAAARLPRAGDWEMVVSVGVGQLAFCAPIPTPPAPRDLTMPGQISPLTADDQRMRLRLVAADGAPAAGINGTLDLAALTGNWRARQAFSTDESGLTKESYDLARHLPLVITVRAATRSAGFAPLVLEEIP